MCLVIIVILGCVEVEKNSELRRRSRRRTFGSAVVSRQWRCYLSQSLLQAAAESNLVSLFGYCGSVMALRVASDVFGLAWRHPFVCMGVLALFTPPFFPVIRFFSPLLISTGVFVVAMVSLGPSSKHEVPQSDSWGFRKASDVGEEKVGQEQEKNLRSSSAKQQRRQGKDSWMDWVKNVEATGLAWVDQKLKNEDWTAPILDDRNVSILQEAFGQRKKTETVPEASKTDAVFNGAAAPEPVLPEEREVKELSAYEEAPIEGFQQAGVVQEVVCSANEMPSEGAFPAAEEKYVVEEALISVMDEQFSAPVIVIPGKPLQREPSVSNPSADPDEGSRQEEAQRQALSSLSMVSRSSDVESPVRPLSTTEKLSVIESLADAIEAQENEPEEAKQKASPVIKALRPSTSDKVTDIIEKLKGFVEDGAPSSNAAPSLVIKTVPPASRSIMDKSIKEEILGSSDDEDEDTSSEDGLVSDSESDSEFQIFPQLKPADIKIHPPVKLDVQRVEQQKAKKTVI